MIVSIVYENRQIRLNGRFSGIFSELIKEALITMQTSIFNGISNEQSTDGDLWSRIIGSDQHLGEQSEHNANRVGIAS